MGELPPRVQERLNQLSEKFRSELPARIEEITVLMGTARTGDNPALRELRNKVHRLAGTAATFGFDSITAAAREMEHLVEMDLAGESSGVGARTEESFRRLSEAWQPGGSEPMEEVPGERNRVLFIPVGSSILTESFADQMSVFGHVVESIDAIESVRDYFSAGPGESEAEYGAIIAEQSFFTGNPDRLRLLKSIRDEFQERLHLVLIAEDSQFDTRLRSVRYGAEAFFEAPVEPTQLLDKLENIFTAASAEPYHVLIVDDDPEQVSETALILQDAGMITSVVSDPENIWQILVEYKPELILLDMYMPRCSGMELASIIRQNDSFVSVPIVFLSVERDAQKQLEAIRSGGDDFLTKPIDPEHLVTSVRLRANRTRAMRFYMERDSLTGLLNHTNLKNRLSHELERAMRIGTELSFVMLDLDHFKMVNDTYGHLTGDRVLKGLSRLLQDRLRRTDVIGRYGGEEFALILFNTEAQQAMRIVNEIRVNFSRIRQNAGDREFTVTLSAGIAEYPIFESASALNGAADEALYEAKKSGRNRVVLASP